MPEKTTSTARTPIEFFEQHARAVWQSTLSPNEKALKLYSVRDSINKYVKRAQVELSERAKKQDSWSHFACFRGISYLERLAEDLRRLATSCQQVDSDCRA